MDENYIATGRSRQAIERQRYTFTLILDFVFAKFMNILNQLKYGSRRLSGSRRPMNWMVSKEYQLSSNGKNFPEHTNNTAVAPRDPKDDRREEDST